MATDRKLRSVVFRDYRSRWDGVVQKILAGPRAERSISPGEIGIFTPTGEVEMIEERTQLRDGREKVKQVEALVYQRTGTRLV